MMTVGENIAEYRRRRGWSQQHLARLLGVSRQTVVALEGDQRLPHLALAVKLAAALELSLETMTASLQTAEDSPPAVSVTWLHGTAPLRSGPAVWSMVREHLIAVPCSSLASVGHPDCWWDAEAQRLIALPESRPPERVLLVGGCDPFLPWAKEAFRRQHAGYWLEPVRLSSQAALLALKAGQLAAAGTHLYDDASRSYNRVQPFLPFDICQIPYLQWEEGMMRRPPTASPPRTWAIREPGSEAHALFYRQAPSGHDADIIVIPSHQGIVDSVVSGTRSAGVGLGSLAVLAGLEFEPWATETYEWIVRAEDQQADWFKRWQSALHAPGLDAAYKRLPFVRRVD
ncbi:MAG: helix-turn-helix domain-containing protein [Thermaerobacter sp.]|nr:helix-turn-helix domain-containing protein [Thermaerobacter sp.]